MPSHTSNEAKKSLNHTIKMMSGSIFTAPASWKIETLDTYVQMTAPENDLSIYFLELSMTQPLSNLAMTAWKQIQPHFNFSPAQESTVPPTDNWEQICQIIYDVPTSEARMVMAIIRIFKDQAYLCLVDSKMAGFSRRGAELGIMVESWKPVGFKETQLNDNETKNWTAVDIQSFEKFISDSMQRLEIPGVSIAIVRQDGTSIYKKGFGTKQLGLDEPVTTDTPFMIGSITKPLTTLLIAALVDKGKLSWETPVTKILPNFSVNDADLTQKMNIRHTVSASTGMPRGGFEALFKSRIKPEDRLLEMKEMKPTTKIGETFQYSNYLVMAGGYAAASAFNSEINLEDAYNFAMKKMVFDPLNMKRTVIKMEEALRLGAALPHGFDFNGKPCKISIELENFAYALAPAGAIWSTVNDMSRYLLTEMNNGVLDGNPVISKEAILERRKPGVKIGEKSSYGLCLMISNEQGLNIVGHGGNTMGFSSDLFFLPEKGIGVVILTNAFFANYFLYAVKQKFLELTFSAKLRSEEMIEAALREREQAIKKNHSSILLDPASTDWIENILGEFSNTRLGSAKLSRTNDGKSYDLEFKEWKSRVGVEIEKNGKKNLVLIDPPSYCGLKLLVEDDGNKLVFLGGGQEQHDFLRTTPALV